MARKPDGLHPEDIKSRIRKKFGSMAEFARRNKRNPNTISNAIFTPGYSTRIERMIAEELGMTPQSIWPDRYHMDGTSVSFRDDRTPTALTGSAHRQNEVAA
ncbi:helix-turn-helix domain-containing protein [Acetobacter malorum]|uniref:helix-turn-helix domain-containing protein n=1 Tax=Acetobacter malorum TaxID=178901 RepID=UPI0039E9E9D8